MNALPPALGLILFCFSNAFSQERRTEGLPAFIPEQAIQNLASAANAFNARLSRRPDSKPQVMASLEYILKQHPGRDQNKKRQQGDPLNLVFIGAADQIRSALTRAGWTEVPPYFWSAIGLSLEDIYWHGQSAKHFPMFEYSVDGKTQDLSWAQEIKLSTRHHFRLWKTNLSDPRGRPVWWGSGNYDNGIQWALRLSKISHIPDPDMNLERDYIRQSLAGASEVESTELVPLSQVPQEGKNDRGYSFHSDGQVLVVIFR